MAGWRWLRLDLSTMNFELIPSRRRDIASFLNERVPDFVRSAEYRSHNGDADDLPGVLMASFAHFLARLSRSTPPQPSLQGGLDIVSTMLDWEDREVSETIEDEFFVALESDPRTIRALLPLMKPELRNRFEQWRQRPN